jgi:hypothetical protein
MEVIQLKIPAAMKIAAKIYLAQTGFLKARKSIRRLTAWEIDQGIKYW